MAGSQILKKLAGLGGLMGLAGLPALALTVTDAISPNGIDALRLHQAPYNLLGRKIAIGQVEVGRPGQFGVDKAVSRYRAIAITQVFFRNHPAKTNTNVDSHAQSVAGIMISKDKALPGIAPAARLYASAAGTTRRDGQPEDCLSAQKIAAQNGGDVRAINFSFGESLQHDPRPISVLDGNALLTQCVDWSARVHDVLYVVAGNQGKGGIPIPTDNFNGMNVAYTMRLQGIYTKVDFANISDPAAGFVRRIVGQETNLGRRGSVSLVAPGSQVSLLAFDGRIIRGSGTSFAAPMVTATVALLQEWGDRQLRQHHPHSGDGRPTS
ncbi:S8 family serine peptidase [Neosynechococcus sphagnicola]|uniref:S8 family serine peptidase n=1 Tax=Neosynechococcus sphagnicola TaxID=1501145 RepID=UPI000B006172|nr:S8 family serine peptidase [Neosynechococcus sphagnicola]